jgi:hypothetical protein
VLTLTIAPCHICRNRIALVNGLCQDCYEALEVIRNGARPAVEEKNAPYTGWAILELMGHRRLSGYLTEQTIAGAGMLRIDLPATEDLPAATQFYSPAAVYAITPATPETVAAVATLNRPKPVEQWELPQPKQTIRCAQCAGTTTALYHVLRGQIYCDSCFEELDEDDDPADMTEPPILTSYDPYGDLTDDKDID